MRVVTPTGDNDIVIIPRVYSASYDITITDRQTNVSTTVTAESISQDNSDYITITIAEDSYDFNESSFYDLTIDSETGKLMHRDILFCTSQTIDQDVNNTYDINEGEYTPNETTNEYIVI
jgi:hypothetical protein